MNAPRTRYHFVPLSLIACFFLSMALSCRREPPHSTPTPAPRPTPKPPSPKPPKVESPRKIQTALDVVSGQLCQVGNAPSFEMVVEGFSKSFGQGQYHITGPKVKDIKRLPLGPITLKGKIRCHRMHFGNSKNQALIRLEIEVNEYTR